MKTRYKILIIILIAIPASVLISLVIQSIQYDVIISQFERQCQNFRKSHNDSSIMCAWPGGPPQKPILQMP